jgi:hypothetical protein
MRYFFDIEFIEDGKTIDLISIGVVSEDGREYYAESADADLSRANPWVHEHVFPHLRKGPSLLSRELIARQITQFVGEKPEFWAYYADYDWVVLCQLYGRMVDLPPTWPKFCFDVKQLAVSLGNPKLEHVNGVEHHALADARWVHRTYNWLRSI